MVSFLILASFSFADTANPALAKTIWPQVRTLNQQESLQVTPLNQQITALTQNHKTESDQCSQQNLTFKASLDELDANLTKTRFNFGEQRATLLDPLKPGYLADFKKYQENLISLKTEEDTALKNLQTQNEASRKALLEKYRSDRDSLISAFAVESKSIK